MGLFSGLLGKMGILIMGGGFGLIFVFFVGGIGFMGGLG